MVRLEDEVVGQTDGGMDLEVNKVDREKQVCENDADVVKRSGFGTDYK